MIDYLKYMDIFSIRFHLYTRNQPRFRNAFGGFMSSIFYITCLGIFIIFSYEDIYKLNPISSKSEIVDAGPKIININKEKIWIPFRMVSFEEKFLDHRGILYISPYYVEGKYNHETGMDLKYHLLDYKLCNETSMANKTQNYKIDIKLNQLFCIDKDDIPFGGSWNDPFINYIEINLYLCIDGVDLNTSDPRCSKMEALLNNTTYLFEIFYPVVQFQPTNFESPMAIIYRSYFYRLSKYGYKVERLYLQEHILSDDRSNIITKYKNSSFWGASILYGDDYFLPNKFVSLNINNSSRIYSLNIYMDNGYIYYTRTYKKIFLIIANVFPLFKVALYILCKFTQHIKMSFIKRQLAGLIFENKEKRKHSLIRVRNLNNNINYSKNKIEITKKNDNDKRYKNMNNNFDIKSSNDINNKNNDLKKNIFEQNNKDIIFNNNSLNKSNISLNSDNAIKVLNKKEIFLINSKKKYFTLHGNLNKENAPKENRTIKLSKRKKYIFSYYYFFLDFLFDKLVNPKKFCFLSNNYFTVYNFMCRIYDISNYILLFRQFNLLNNIVKKNHENDELLCLSKQYQKINVNDNDLINKVNIELKSEKSILFSNYL